MTLAVSTCPFSFLFFKASGSSTFMIQCDPAWSWIGLSLPGVHTSISYQFMSASILTVRPYSRSFPRHTKLYTPFPGSTRFLVKGTSSSLCAYLTQSLFRDLYSLIRLMIVFGSISEKFLLGDNVRNPFRSRAS